MYIIYIFILFYYLCHYIHLFSFIYFVHTCEIEIYISVFINKVVLNQLLNNYLYIYII